MLTTEEEAKPLTADLMREVAVDGDGAPLAGEHVNEAQWSWARIGGVTFKIVDPGADDLARDLGAVGKSEDPASEPPRLCLRALIEVTDGQPAPRMGDVLILDAEGVPLMFTFWTGYDDAHAPIPADMLGEATEPDDCERNQALDSLQPGEALLVQTHQLIGADGTLILQ